MRKIWAIQPLVPLRQLIVALQHRGAMNRKFVLGYVVEIQRNYESQKIDVFYQSAYHDFDTAIVARRPFELWLAVA